MVEHGFNTQQTLEVGGPGGIRVSSQVPALDVAPRSREPGQTLALAMHHPRATAVALGLMGTGLLAGPLVLVLALELPAWILVGPVVLSTAALVAAVAVFRGALTRLERARRRPQFEHQLLDLAAHTRGRLTVPLAARHLAISMPEAEELLTAFARAGYVDIDNDPQTGTVLYLFPSLDTEHP